MIEEEIFYLLGQTLFIGRAQGRGEPSRTGFLFGIQGEGGLAAPKSWSPLGTAEPFGESGGISGRT
jgi:hypothetical protein